MTEEILTAVREEIKVTVNGKIDNIRNILEYQNSELRAAKLNLEVHNAKHERDMQRILPVIEAFEYSERRVEDAQSAGWLLIKLSGFVTALGGAYLIIRQVFRI